MNDVSQKLNELKNKIETNSEKLNKMKEIEINEFQIPKERPIQTQINDDNNKNKEEELKVKLNNMEKNYLNHIINLKNECNQFKDEQKEYNEIILENIKLIKNEINNIKKKSKKK